MRSPPAPPDAPRSPCLSEDELAALVSSEGGSALVRKAATHFDACEPCRRLAASLMSDDGPAGSAEHRAEGTPTTLAPGEEIGGRYRIERFLARGGMGEVYEAHDLTLGEIVALKTLRATALDDYHAISRLKEEVLLARRVTHPNVCRLLEFGVHAKPSWTGVAVSVPYLTMELLRGETLRARLDRDGAWAPDEARALLVELSHGLEAIHAAGIVHRDLKCENVFLVPRAGQAPRVVIMDLGLARPIEHARGLTGGYVVGTLEAMAPEQIEGAAPTPAFDVYALGVLAFEVCTGKRPFEGPTAMAVAMERLARPAPLPSALRPELGVAWDEAIGRCLARDPARRFARVADVRNALQAPPPAIKRRSGARWLLAVAGLGGSALAVGLAPQRPASTVRPSSPAPAALSLATTAIAPSAPTTAALTSAPAPRARVLVAPVSSPTTPPPVRSAAPSRRPRAEPVVPRPLPTTVVAPAPATPAAPSSAPRPGHVDDVYNPFAKKP